MLLYLVKSITFSAKLQFSNNLLIMLLALEVMVS